MFRWLKDRNKKGRKSSGSVRSKEDDYGFKQKQGAEGKRDLPPTPADLMTSCHVTDDDKSFHIYEEIPDLPFRCTPEGELRISLAREMEASRRESQHSVLSLSPGSHNSSARNISPYMVVPLERLGASDFHDEQEDTTQFRASKDDSSQFRASKDDSSQFRASKDDSFACAFVGRNRGEEHRGTQEVEGSPSVASTCSPSCCGSSVFGSPLGLADRCSSLGGDGGDISDRLLSAINLTRLLAAVRLSSSSADTCTTSPICIGVDKDGRNISVSVSVTPTAACNSSNNNANDDDNHHADPRDLNTKTNSRASQDNLVSKTETGLASSSKTSLASSHESGFVSKLESSFVVAKSETGLDGCSKPGLTQPSYPGLRFLPSPLEQNALSEILQLGPGESTELDPAAIDALILKLCSHTLQSNQPGEGKSSLPRTGTTLQRQELEDVERMLKEMVRASGEAGEGRPHDPSSSSRRHRHRSPAARRAENSDTGYEYDVSTSSESDHTNYDYFLSKVARTRSLECEVKKLACSSDSSHDESDDEDDEEEDEEDEKEERRDQQGTTGDASFSSVSAVSAASRRNHRQRVSPEVATSHDSDDGTMADLSDSENSSGYYESHPGQGVHSLTATSATRTASPGNRNHNLTKKKKSSGATSESKKSSSEGKKSSSEGKKSSSEARDRKKAMAGAVSDRKKALPGAVSGRRKIFSSAASDGKDDLGDLEVQCYELDEMETEGARKGDYSSDCLAAIYSPLSECERTMAAPECLSASRPRHSKGAGGKKSRTQHKASTDNGGGRDRRKGEGVNKTTDSDGEKSAGLGAASHARSSSLCDKDSNSNPTDSRRGSADAASSKPLSSHAHSTKLKDKKHSSSKPRGIKDSNPSAISTQSSRHTSGSTSDYPYSFLYRSGTITSSSGSSGVGTSNPRSHPKTTKTLKDLNRTPSFQSEQPESVYGGSRQTSEVYSFPPALPDPSAPVGGGGNGLRGSTSVPCKLSVSRQVPASSEVYGTRAGLQGCTNNRLLSDLIMLNYNRQVLHL